MLCVDLDLAGLHYCDHAVGDVDFICNWIGNFAWTKQMPWAHHDDFNAETDHDWVVDGSVAGSARTASNFTFLRVADAGHMVPLDKPVQALSMVNSFLSNTPFY